MVYLDISFHYSALQSHIITFINHELVRTGIDKGAVQELERMVKIDCKPLPLVIGLITCITSSGTQQYLNNSQYDVWHVVNVRILSHFLTSNAPVNKMWRGMSRSNIQSYLCITFNSP